VVEHALETVPCAAVFVPTRTGITARMISRFNPAVWIVALSRQAEVCQGLAFSYGVYPVHLAQEPENWGDFVGRWLREHQIPGALAMLVAGPCTRNPDANYRLEFLRVADHPARADT
jgi:pyruvate kinase